MSQYEQNITLPCTNSMAEYAGQYKKERNTTSNSLHTAACFQHSNCLSLALHDFSRKCIHLCLLTLQYLEMASYTSVKFMIKLRKVC